MESRIYLHGRVSVNRDETASIIADKLVDIRDTKKELWTAFEDIKDYEANKNRLEELCFENGGKAAVIVFLRKERQVKKLGSEYNTDTSEAVIVKFNEAFGEDNVKIRETGI